MELELSGILLCRWLTMEEETGRVADLGGLFSAVTPTTWPMAMKDPAFAYAEVSGVRVPTMVELSLQLLRTDELHAVELWKTDRLLNPLTDKRATHQIVVPLTGCVLPAPGEYRWELRRGPTLLARRRMIGRTLIPHPEPEPRHSHGPQ
jgi:hypothetical protein